MKIAIMQPYFFPYLGYFHLIKSVDKYIIYDDVNYIKQGWINRNRILLNEKAFYITLRLKEASSFKKINDIEIIDNKIDILKILKQAYTKAPFFKAIFPLLDKVLTSDENNLGKYVAYSIFEICNYLKIKTDISISSEIKKNNDLKGENKIIHICQLLKADVYINANGGQELYNRDQFKANGIELKFVKSNLKQYKQFGNSFLKGLSIIDIMMFNSPLEIQNMLDDYEIL